MAEDTAITLNLSAVQRSKLKEDDGRDPDLSLGELMVHAIARSISGRMTPLAIHQWLLINFKHYAARHEECQKRGKKNDNADYMEPCRCETEIVNQISGAFASRTFLYGLMSPFQFHKIDRSISLVPGSAQLALFPSELQEPKFEKYNQLPAELRLEILRHAFTFDMEGPGWKVKGVERWPWESRYYFQATVNGHKTARVKLSTMLSPLLVNKQMRAEAGSLFFTQNTFHFENCLVMRRFMEKLGPQNRQLVTNVSLDYMLPSSIDRDRANANSAFRYLAEANNLLNLRLNMQEENAARPGYSRSTRSFPGFHILRRFRGLKTITLEGQCDQAMEILGQDLQKPYRKRTGELIKSHAELTVIRNRARARAIKRQLIAELKEQQDLDRFDPVELRDLFTSRWRPPQT